MGVKKRSPPLLSPDTCRGRFAKLRAMGGVSIASDSPCLRLKRPIAYARLRVSVPGCAVRPNDAQRESFGRIPERVLASTGTLAWLMQSHKSPGTSLKSPHGCGATICRGRNLAQRQARGGNGSWCCGEEWTCRCSSRAPWRPDRWGGKAGWPPCGSQSTGYEFPGGRFAPQDSFLLILADRRP
jgi:hypothetical protein